MQTQRKAAHYSFKDCLAQLVEHKALNLTHMGSGPAGSSSHFMLPNLRLAFLLVLDLFCYTQQPVSFEKGLGST